MTQAMHESANREAQQPMQLETATKRRFDLRPPDLLGVMAALIPAALMLFMVVHTNANLPRSDTSFNSLLKVEAMSEGEFGLDDLFEQPKRHPYVTMHLTTWALYHLTEFNISTGRVVAWGVAFAGYLVMGLLALHTLGRRALWAWPLMGIVYFPLSNMTIFALYEGISQFYLIFFNLAACVVVLMLPRGPRTLALAFVLALLAGVSFTSGLVAWGLVFLALVYRGYRAWWAYALLAVGLASSVGTVLYVQSGYLQVAGEGNTISPENLRILLPYLAVYLGRMFHAGTQPETARNIGYLGMAFFAGMSVYLWWATRHTKAVVAWGLAATFALLQGVLISLGDEQETGFGTAMYTRYITTSSVFWAAFVGLFASVVTTVPLRLRWLHPVLMLAVGALLSVLAVRFVPATYSLLYHNRENDVRLVNEPCHLRYLYHRDVQQMHLDECVMLNVDVDRISYYEVAMFADHEAINMFADGLESSLPIIQTTHQPGINFNTQKWLLAGIAPEQVLHVAPLDGGRYTDDLSNFFTGATPDLDEHVGDFVGDAPLFWYVYQEAQHPGRLYHEIDLTRLFADDYTYVERTYETRQGVPFQQRLYVQRESDAEPLATFVPDLQMRRLIVANEVAACESLDVVGAWSLGEPLELPVPASLSLVLLDENGAIVARNDSQLSVVPSTEWELDQLVVDLRTLAIPCELFPGDYTLGVSIYDYRSADDPFPLVGADGDRAQVATVRVTAATS
jgi:hypothetical protein